MTIKGKRVLVTGADGFIGSHLTERLVREGADVRAFCLYNSNGSWGWLEETPAEIKEKLDVRLGDIRDARFVEEVCKDIETVFHLAALIAIPYSYIAPASFVQTNVTGTLNILEGARRAGCERVIHTSTSEVYGTPATVPIRETHPLQGQSPYSATKIAADKLCEAFHKSYDLPVIVLRPFNTYGPRQSMRAILPTILVQLFAGKEEIHLGNLEPRRDLTYVTDTVNGFLRAAEADGIEGEVVQLGTGLALSIGELFEVCRKVVSVKAHVVEDEKRIRPSGSEVMVLLSEPAKAREVLGWNPEISLEEGIEKTANWIRENLGRFSAERYVV